MSVLPEDFRDAARRRFAKALRPFLDPETKRVLIERAKILMRIAVRIEDSISIRERLRERTSHTSSSALEHLKGQLIQLAPGMTHHMATSAYVGLFKN